MSKKIPKNEFIYVNTYLPIRYLKAPVHKVIQRTVQLFDMNIKVKIVHSRYPNVQENLLSDFNCKVLEEMGKEDKITQQVPCNCRKKCRFGEECGKKLVIYRITEKQTKQFYVGSTARKLKTRVAEHMYDLRKNFTNPDSKSDSFATFFSTLDYGGRDKKGIKTEEIWDFFDYEVVRSIKSVSNAKTFSCGLCCAERYEIVRSKMLQEKIVNQNNEIYFTCRHTNNWKLWVEK